MAMRSFSLIVKSCTAILLLLSVCSCTHNRQNEEIEQLVTDWIGREIIFPDSLTAELQNHPLVIDLDNEGYSILTVLNAENGCTSCQMMLPEWEQLMKYAEASSHNSENINLIYVIESTPTNGIRNVIKEFDFKYPVIYDPDKTFDRLNDFSDQVAFRTFLLDGNNIVKVIGNPITIRPLKDVYHKELSQGDSTYSRVENLPYRLSSNRIPLGAITDGKRIISSVTIKNNSDSTIRIDKVVSSCHCVSNIIRKKVLTPGSESELKIFFYSDSLQEIDTEQEIFRNVYVYFNDVEKPAEIELYGYYYPDEISK